MGAVFEALVTAGARADQCVRHWSCKFVLRVLHCTPRDVDVDSPVDSH